MLGVARARATIIIRSKLIPESFQASKIGGDRRRTLRNCSKFPVELEDAWSITLREAFAKIIPYSLDRGGKKHRFLKVRFQGMQKPRENHVIATTPSRVSIRVVGGRRFLDIASDETKFILGTQGKLHATGPGCVVITIQLLGYKDKIRVVGMMKGKNTIGRRRVSHGNGRESCRKKN